MSANGRKALAVATQSRFVGWIVTTAWLTVSAGASAQPMVPDPQLPPAEIELEWRAPPSCPDAAQLRTRIAELLTGPARGEGTVLVVGDIRHHAGGLRLELSTDFQGRFERRVLDAPSCDELAEATAILLAYALEPELEPVGSVPAPPLKETPEAQSEPDREPEPTLPGLEPVGETRAGPSPRSPPDRGTLPAAARTARPQLRLRVAAAVEAGALPGITAGPRLAVGVVWPRVRLELHGGYLAPRRNPRSGAGAVYQAGFTGLRGCGRPRVGPVELPVCGGVEAGAIRASTRGFDVARTRHGPWVAPFASVGVAARWGRVGLWSALEAAAPLYSGEFELPGDVGFRRFPVSGRAVIGIEIIVIP